MIHTVPNTAAAESLAVPIEQLQTRGQIRTRNGFDKESLAELADSIKAHGILQPLIVTPGQDGGYWVVAGERRLLAASMAGLAELPVIVRHDQPADLAAIQAVENLQREDLNPADVAEGLAALAQVHGSWRAVARAIGKSPAWVSKRRALTRMRPIASATMRQGISTDPDLLLSLDQVERIDADAAAKLANGLQLGTVSREDIRRKLVQLKDAKTNRAADDSEGEGEGEGDNKPAAKRAQVQMTHAEREWLIEAASQRLARALGNDLLPQGVDGSTIIVRLGELLQGAQLIVAP